MSEYVQAIFPKGLFESPFQPAKGIRHGHLQTMFPRYHRRKRLVIDRRREELKLPDGDHLILDWHEPVHAKNDTPLTLIVHGLSGTSMSHYVVGLQKSLSAIGWPSVAMNCRGAIRPNDRLQAYHAGAGGDIVTVLETLVKTQTRPLMLVGYSLGGCMSLQALAMIGESTRIKAAACVSVPLNLPKCADRMSKGFSRLYTKVLLKELVRQWLAKRDRLIAIDRPDDAKRIETQLSHGPFRNFWDFDEHVGSRIHGFDGVHDYYAKCDPHPYFSVIRIPTLLIHASDDPFMSPDVIPDPATFSPSIHFELARHGGHVGFVGGSIRRPVYYLEERIPLFLKSVWERNE